MMVKHTITYGQWHKISDVGESGTAWLKSANGFRPRLVFSHTDSAQTPADDFTWAQATDLDEGIGLFWKTNEVTPILESEPAGDIWYCTLRNGGAGATCEIVADFL
jgi:hypothetical protein